MNCRKIGFVIFILILGIVVNINVALAEDNPTDFTILTCPLGCGGFEAYTVFGNLFSEANPGLRLVSQETPGYVYNITVMERDEAKWVRTVFGSTPELYLIGKKSDILVREGIFKKQFKQEFRRLWQDVYTSTFFVTLDSNIKSIDDFKGKRIGVGTRQQSDQGFLPVLLLNGSGITSKNAKIEYLGPERAVEAMLDGKIDVVFGQALTQADLSIVIGLKMIHVLEASKRDFYYIGIAESAFSQIDESLGTKGSAEKIVIPAGILPKQTGATVTGAWSSCRFVHISFPEEIAYKITKYAINSLDQLKEHHPLFALLSHKSMIHNLTEENTHPGAIRAYKEAGLWNK